MLSPTDPGDSDSPPTDRVRRIGRRRSGRPPRQSHLPQCECGGSAPRWGGTARAVNRELGLDGDPAPERDVVLDLLGGLLRRRIVPGGVLVDLITDYDVVIARGPLPSAHGVRVARPQVLAVTLDGGKYWLPSTMIQPSLSARTVPFQLARIGVA